MHRVAQSSVCGGWIWPSEVLYVAVYTSSACLHQLWPEAAHVSLGGMELCFLYKVWDIIRHLWFLSINVILREFRNFIHFYLCQLVVAPAPDAYSKGGAGWRAEILSAPSTISTASSYQQGILLKNKDLWCIYNRLLCSSVSLVSCVTVPPDAPLYQWHHDREREAYLQHLQPGWPAISPPWLFILIGLL